MADELKIRGPVREIGIARDADRHDSFNITIGITIKTEGRVSYEEAERISSRFRREYLGKDVEFRAIHIPCPHCDKVLNSETGLKQHILKVHPERAELLTPPKVAAKEEKAERKARGKGAAKKVRRHVRRVKAVKGGKTAPVKKPEPAKAKQSARRGPSAVEPMKPVRPGGRTGAPTTAQAPRESLKPATREQTKARQLTLA